MKKRTLVMWSIVAFLGALYWDTNGHPSFGAAAVMTLTPVVLAVLSVRWGL